MEPIPASQVGDQMTRMVPLVATTGLEFVEVSEEHAVVRLGDEPGLRNHVGGPHAAMMFAAAETASGAVAFAAFSDLFDQVVLVPFTATIDFIKVAIGPLTARARLDPQAAQAARDTFIAGSRPEFTIAAEIVNESGEVTGRFTSTWTMRLLRSSVAGVPPEA